MGVYLRGLFDSREFTGGFQEILLEPRDSLRVAIAVWQMLFSKVRTWGVYFLPEYCVCAENLR